MPLLFIIENYSKPEIIINKGSGTRNCSIISKFLTFADYINLDKLAHCRRKYTYIHVYTCTCK